MNPFDMATIVIVSFCVIRGIFRGLVKELSSIIGVLAGFYAAYTYYAGLARLFSRWIASDSFQNIMGFLIIFCLVFFIVSVIGVFIKYMLNIAFMGWFDRICGAGFGLLKGVLIISVLLIIFTAFLPKRDPIVRNSVLAPHVALVSEKMAKVVSKDMKRQFSANLLDLKKFWKIPR
jgi:membrane protein required for colicin V production